MSLQNFSQVASAIWVDGTEVIKSEIRTWAAILEDYVNGSGWQTVAKEADESVTADTSLNDDAELAFAMEANAVYMIRGRIMYTTAATPDFKAGFNGPSSPTQVRGHTRAIAPGASAYSNIDVVTSYETSGIAITGGAGSGVFDFDLIVENGANAGDFMFTWAQNTSNASAATVFRGSYLEYRKLTD